MRRWVGGLALGVTLVGGAWVLRMALAQPRRDAEWEGLRLRLERAVWLHEPTDHGDAAALPALPGVPRPGQRRLTLEFTVFNARARPMDFAPRGLRLAEADAGAVWPPVSGSLEPIALRPAQVRPMTRSFDVPETSAPLRLEWVHGSASSLLLSTRRPPSPSANRSGWPQRVEALPRGDRVAGSALFHGRLACTTCHGDPDTRGSARLGPALGELARAGATRVEGMSAAQYAYESLLDPNAVIAPECPGHLPCARPSAMPLYGELLSPREMADLVSYLVGPRGEE